MRLHAKTILILTLAASFIFWSTLLIVMLSIEYPGEDQRFEQMIQLKTEMIYQRTQSIRRWIGAHGGIYAAIDDKVKPSESLGNHPERDIETPSGRLLTLLNSPAFLRQVSEEFEAESGTRVRFVSDQPIHKANLADDWEREGLAALRSGNNSVSKLLTRGEQARYRLLRPMVMKKNCLTCHTAAPWKIGDISGAISISLDATTEYQHNQSAKRVMLTSHVTMWAVGVVGLFLAGLLWLRLLGRLEQSALRDPLTGIYNRREMLHRLESALSACARYNHPLSVIMFDIDYFKRINDRYGHQTGDEVLKGVAQTIQNGLRNSDILARYGGEEFFVICPHSDLSSATIIAERIRSRIENLAIDSQSGQIHLTISAGVVAYPDYPTVENLIEGADSAMYLAKMDGRNRVVANDQGGATGAS